MGRVKDPDLDRLRALRPDLVIANMEENRREVVETLRAAGLAVWVTFPRTLREGIDLVREVGALTGVPEAAERLAASAEARHAATRARLAGRTPARVFCPIWREPWMSIGPDTYVHDVLAACGGTNVLASRPERYPTVTLEEVAALDPEVVLLPDEPYRFRPAHRATLGPLGGTTALRTRRVHLVDGKLLTWYGPRIEDALARLPALLAP